MKFISVEIYVKDKLIFYFFIIRYLEADVNLINEKTDDSNYKKKFFKLNKALARVIDDYSLVKFTPIDITDEDSINDILLIIDNIQQYGEDLDVKETREFEADDNDDDDDRDNTNNI